LSNGKDREEAGRHSLAPSLSYVQTPQIEHEEGAGTSSHKGNHEAAYGIWQVCWSGESLGDG